MAKKSKKARPFDPDNIWVAVQEGGTSSEIYLHSFDCAQEAEKYEKGCEESSYNCLLVESIERSKSEKAAPFAYVAMKAALSTLLAARSSLNSGNAASCVMSIAALREAIERMEKDDRLADACRANGLTIPKGAK